MNRTSPARAACNAQRKNRLHFGGRSRGCLSWRNVVGQTFERERIQPASAALAASTVRVMSASVCAAERNAASNCDGGQ